MSEDDRMWEALRENMRREGARLRAAIDDFVAKVEARAEARARARQRPLDEDAIERIVEAMQRAATVTSGQVQQTRASARPPSDDDAE